MKYDVFISYSSYNQKIVEAMCAYLEQHKVRCFVAYRDIPKGVVWAKAIVEALDQSKMMVVVFSEEFNMSDQVDREIELASEDKKPILTFRISDAMFKGAKKYYLKNLNWIDAFPHPEKVFDALLDNVCKLIGRPSFDVNTKPVSNNPSSVPEAETAHVSAPKSVSVPSDAGKIWKVGDYYNVDGKEGVVFWVDETGRHGKIVSLDEKELEWCTLAEDKNKRHRGIATDLADGRKNLQSIMVIPLWRYKYPAFAWCAKHGLDWYLPAIDELKEIFINVDVRDALKATLANVKEDSMEFKGRYYWSSSESENWPGRVLHITETISPSMPYACDLFGAIKFIDFSVRAVAAF